MMPGQVSSMQLSVGWILPVVLIWHWGQHGQYHLATWRGLQGIPAATSLWGAWGYGLALWEEARAWLSSSLALWGKGSVRWPHCGERGKGVQPISNPGAEEEAWHLAVQDLGFGNWAGAGIILMATTTLPPNFLHHGKPCGLVVMVP